MPPDARHRPGEAVAVLVVREPKEPFMSDPTFQLEKKTALVIGAANGISRATALAFAAAGAAVACADVEDAKPTAAEIEKSGAQALALHVDVTDSASCRSAVAATVERFGGLDVLFRSEER